MIKKAIITLVFSIVFTVSAYAEGASVAVVDMKRILEESTAAKNVRDKIKKKRDAYQAEITKREEELREADQKLAKQRSILSPEAFEEKRKAHKKQFLELQRDLQDRRTKLATAHTKALNEIEKVVEEIVVNLSREKQFQMAIPRSQILFAEKNLDITSEVVSSLNKKLPKVTIKID